MYTNLRKNRSFGIVAGLVVNAVLACAACGGGGGSSLAPGLVSHQPAPTGSPSPNPTQSPGSTPPPIAAKHLVLWDDLGGDGVTLNPWSLASPWLNYAKTPFMDANAILAAGIVPVPYTDPNRQGPTGPLYTNDESTFAHDCSGNRITQVGGVANGNYIMDPHSAHLAQLWHDYVANEQANGWSFTYVFEDNADELGKVSAMPCGFDQTDWTAATNVMDQALGYSIIFNSLSHTSILNGQPIVSPSIGLNATTSGGMSEDCYVQADGSERNNVNWQATELTEIDMAVAAKLFVCSGTMTSDAAASTKERIYLLASFLLTYDPNTSILASRFNTPSGLHVFPEMQLVALNPLLPQPSSISALLQTGGSYGREYGACYFAGKYVGSCAVVVNSNKPPGPTVPFPWPGKYHHTLVVAGYGVLDGGSAPTGGPGPSANVSPGSAVIAFP